MSTDKEIIRMLVAALEQAEQTFLAGNSVTLKDDPTEQKRLMKKQRSTAQVVSYAVKSGREYLKYNED